MINLNKFLLVLFLMISSSIGANSQILISLLFGDALNSDKIEFGLNGGMNRSFINDISESKGMNNFNLGFYFHVLIKEQSYLSTGVMVKSNVGATGMPTYKIGDDDFDDVFKDGVLTKEINYFYVPILFQQRFHDNRWYLEGGFQAGLRHKAYDLFDKDAFDGTVSFKKDVRDEYARLDGGLVAGVGYKWKKQIKSISTGVNYYYGLANVSKVDGTTIKNSSIYFYVKVPIGANGKKKKDKNSVVD